MDYEIRKMYLTEYDILKNFLYEAIFIPEGISALPKEIINKPELQVYIADFGKKNGDMCMVAEVDNKIIGAVWGRIMNDYGHIDDKTPSLAVSVCRDYRNHGIGTALMKNILEYYKSNGYNQVSLSVQKSNYAVKMYKNVGFEAAGENEEEYIMICKLF